MKQRILLALLLLLVLVLPLTACSSGGHPNTTARTTTSPLQTTTLPPTTTATTTPSQTMIVQSTTTATQQPNGTLMQLPLETPIFSAPSYDDFFVQLVGQDGVYTIMETTTDTEGNLWGRLKSGIGWVDLTALAEYQPVSVFFAEASMQNDIRYSYAGEPSEYASEIVFRAHEELGKITFSLLAWTESGLAVDQTLSTVERLSVGEMFAAKIVFYGDLTTYGISFTDSAGRLRSYAVSVSGRNGMLILTEY